MNLEIGGGKFPQQDGYIRLDIRPLVGCVDVAADGKYLPFKSEVFNRIYTRHVIEHWGHRESLAVLSEWLRVLKPEGTLEIHCPDLLKIISLHANGKLDDGQLAFYIYGGQEYPENLHKTGFTQKRLVGLVKKCGGVFVRRQHDKEDHLEMKVLFKK